MTSIFLATEDELSEQVGLRLAEDVGLKVTQRPYRGRGFGSLRKKIHGFCEMSRRQPVLLLTDLDQGVCASALISDWMGTRNRPDGLIFRVAVREIESWLLADHEGIRELLGTKVGKLPRTPDDLPDPKRELLALAQKAPREIREELVARKGAVAPQGLGYNAVLGRWVKETWRINRAVTRSNSLSKARIRLGELAGA